MRYFLIFLFLAFNVEVYAETIENHFERPTDTTKRKKSKLSDTDIIRIAIEKDIDIFINERNRILKLNHPILDTLSNRVSGVRVVGSHIQKGEYIEVEVEKIQVDSSDVAFSTTDIIVVNQSFRAKNEIKSKRSRGKRILYGFLIAGGVVLVAVFFGLLSIVYF